MKKVVIPLILTIIVWFIFITIIVNLGEKFVSPDKPEIVGIILILFTIISPIPIFRKIKKWVNKKKEAKLGEADKTILLEENTNSKRNSLIMYILLIATVFVVPFLGGAIGFEIFVYPIYIFIIFVLPITLLFILFLRKHPNFSTILATFFVGFFFLVGDKITSGVITDAQCLYNVYAKMLGVKDCILKDDLTIESIRNFLFGFSGLALMWIAVRVLIWKKITKIESFLIILLSLYPLVHFFYHLFTLS